MPFQLNLPIVLMLVYSQACYEEIRLSMPNNSATITSTDKLIDIAYLSYGNNLSQSDPPVKTVIEYPGLICLGKGRYSEIKTSRVKPIGTKYVIMKSIDFGGFEEFSDLVIRSDDFKGSWLCFFLGSHMFYESNGTITVHIYLNFLTDLKTVDEKDVLYLSMKNEELKFSVEISRSKVIANQQEKTTEKVKILSQDCIDKTKDSTIKFDLTGQSFKVQPNGVFSMAFLNTKDISTQPSKNPSTEASFKCLKDSLDVIYSNQSLQRNLVVV